MKVSELIKELEEFKDTYGDLEVGVYKDDESGQYGEYFADIDIGVIRTKKNKTIWKIGWI